MTYSRRPAPLSSMDSNPQSGFSNIIKNGLKWLGWKIDFVAGQAGVLGQDDGIGGAASFDGIVGIASDGVRVWVTDGLLRRVTAA